ncbi:alpha-glucosidase [Lactobacillus pentosus] [Lactiplantibacillus mudanjiangensis]|uniref:alpha-glucosidase n=1 Tax=Lactiplantibacillus mudanjiangensis TaxID=1296538 RepID=UPI0010140CB9|nr:alpha-glucosidase [Lactobacillus pentosus] [Lactiplantibacillus mudanjiangensis]
MQTTWWQKEVFYQIYPASFKDTNNDGIGDLQGIIQMLPRLKALGITTIWLSPIYQSPMVDNGYDISDYQAINPQFGTMADFDELMARTKALGLKVVMDLVLNHTSDQHAWFKQALADPTSPYRNYYIFKSGKQGNPPNNWRSNFGKGSSWTLVPGATNEYYHHVFSKQQPDLNWENPELRQQLYQMINWWLAKGIAGFRIDAITFIKKDQDFASITPDGTDGLGKVKRKAENRPGIEQFLTELNAATFKPANAVTIGEASGVDYDQLGHFIGENGYFSMIFDFHYADIDVASGSEWYRQVEWTPVDLRAAIFKSQLAIQKVGWSATFLENHDQPRSIDKYIQAPAYQNEIGAKALALLYFNLRGCPFIYQGQELGLRNAKRTSIADFNDLSSHDNYDRALEEGYSAEAALRFVNARSRDNGRLPYPWDQSVNHGFNQGTKPWIGLNESCPELDWVSEQADTQSVWHFYQAMIALRQQSSLSLDLITGTFKPITTTADTVIAYQRGQHVVVYVNLSDQVVNLPLPKGKKWLNNYTTSTNDQLQPYQAILIEVNPNE